MLLALMPNLGFAGGSGSVADPIMEIAVSLASVLALSAALAPVYALDTTVAPVLDLSASLTPDE